VPCYDRWYKWTKFSLNAASAVLGWGVLIVRGGDLSDLEDVKVLYILLILLRTVEVAKDSIPLVRTWHQTGMSCEVQLLMKALTCPSLDLKA